MGEDHCWVSVTGSAERSSMAEVATMAAEQQGQPPSEQDWCGWLYNGGHAVLCTPHQVLAAMVASVDTCIGTFPVAAFRFPMPAQDDEDGVAQPAFTSACLFRLTSF